MADNRLPLLILAAAGLGALLWWDMHSAPDRPDAVAADGREPEGQAAPAAMPARGPERFPAMPPRGPIAGMRPDTEAEPRSAPAGPEMAPGGGTANPLAGLDKASLRAMTQRPLFTPARRPPPAPAPREAGPAIAPPPPPPSPPDYALLGVIRDSDRAIALLRGRSDGRTLRVEAGDMIGGWEIANVDSVSVRLKRRDGTAHELRLAPR